METNISSTHIKNMHIKCTLVQVLRLCTGRTAQRGSRGIALLFHDHGTRKGWRVSVTPRPLFTPGKTWYPLYYRRLGGPQGRSGQVRKISHPPGFDHRTVQFVASRYTDYATRPTNTKIYRTIILPVVLHGCETWSPTLREERRLMVFTTYNQQLRGVFDT